MQTFPSPPARRPRRRYAAFTIVEAMVALAILGVAAMGGTAILNIMDTRSARNRNAEIARTVLDDYINLVIASASTPAATADGTDIDGDGTVDGVTFTSFDTRSLASTNGVLPMVVTRTATPTTIVSGTLYWRVQAVGKTYSLAADTDLMQVNFLLSYTFRGQTFYYKALTFKAKT